MITRASDSGSGDGRVVGPAVVDAAGAAPVVRHAVGDAAVGGGAAASGGERDLVDAAVVAAVALGAHLGDRAADALAVGRVLAPRALNDFVLSDAGDRDRYLLALRVADSEHLDVDDLSFGGQISATGGAATSTNGGRLAPALGSTVDHTKATIDDRTSRVNAGRDFSSGS